MKTFLLLSAGLLLGWQAQAASAPAKTPNFLVILTDDQSWVGTSLLMDPARPDTKSDYFQTPHMETLLTAGMRFSDGYASGAWCTPSRRSIQCGRGPSQHIYNRALDGQEKEYATWLSIPRMLKQVNPAYTCAHFGKWHLQYESLPPQALGYDVSDGNTTNANGDLSTPASTGGKSVAEISDDPKTLFSLTKRTGDFIETQLKAGHPWFVQLSHYAVHLKIGYRQPTFDKLEGRPLGQKHAVREFAAMTEDLDAGLGELMARLEKLNVLSNTYIIFLSDNGGRGKLPVSGQRDQATKPLNYPLAESKHSIYEGGLRVPFAISGPGIKSGAVSHVPVSGVDILPTVADLAGFSGPLGAGLDGGSFKPVAMGQAASVKRPHDFLVFESAGGELPRHTANPKRSDYKAALRMSDYKLIKFYGGAGNGQTELYNLTDDLGEDKNLASAMPDRVKEMEKLLDAYLADVGGLTQEEKGAKKSRKKLSSE